MENKENKAVRIERDYFVAIFCCNLRFSVVSVRRNRPTNPPTPRLALFFQLFIFTCLIIMKGGKKRQLSCDLQLNASNKISYEFKRERVRGFFNPFTNCASSVTRVYTLVFDIRKKKLIFSSSQRLRVRRGDKQTKFSLTERVSASHSVIAFYTQHTKVHTLLH